MTAIIPIAPAKPQRRATEPASYEARLSTERAWAMDESDAHFQGRSLVHKTLQRVCQSLAELNIHHAVVGTMAMFLHGLRRFTENVDLLVTPEDYRRLRAELEGHDYLPPFDGSRHLRDTETKVKIKFFKTGDFPGDGKPKPFAFPDPADVVEVRGGIPVVRLTTLVELKITSGVSSPDRRKDLADAQELIKVLSLPANFADQLHPYVRDSFSQLWSEVHPGLKRHLRHWPCSTGAATRTLAELAQSSPKDSPLLTAMQADGVQIDTSRPTVADGIGLVTTDPVVAAKYDMHDESEFKQGHRLVGSAQPVGWDQRRFATPATMISRCFLHGGPALEASLSHPT